MMDNLVNQSDGACLRVDSGKEHDPMLIVLLEFAESVEVYGEPNMILLQHIVAVGPLIRRMRIEEKYAALFEPGTEFTDFLASQEITFEIGTKKTPRNSTRHTQALETQGYRDKRYFMLHLDIDRVTILFELKKYAAEDVRIASRYLCLDGEKHLSLHQVANLLGVSSTHVTNTLSTVLYMLDSPFEVSQPALRRAASLEEMITESKKAEDAAKEYTEWLKSLGLKVSELPEGIPYGSIDTYAIVWREWNKSRLDESTVTPRERLVLIRRYGLLDRRFRTLEEVGQEMTITRERVRQIEYRALKRFAG